MLARTLLLTATLLPGLVQAADAVLPAPDVGDVAVSLGGIIVLILVLAWGLRRMRMPGASGTANGIKIVSAMPVGARERIVLLQVGKQQLLVGMGPGHMETLHVLEQPLAEQPTAKELSNFAGSFAGKLRQAMTGRGR